MNNQYKNPSRCCSDSCGVPCPPAPPTPCPPPRPPEMIGIIGPTGPAGPMGLPVQLGLWDLPAQLVLLVLQVQLPRQYMHNKENAVTMRLSAH